MQLENTQETIGSEITICMTATALL